MDRRDALRTLAALPLLCVEARSEEPLYVDITTFADTPNTLPRIGDPYPRKTMNLETGAIWVENSAGESIRAEVAYLVKDETAND